MKRMACVIALGAGVTLSATAHTALADPIPMRLLRGLQINLKAPGTVDGSETVLLDVHFRGGNVRSIELYIDGELIKKQGIRTQEGRGVISFALEGMLLTEGSHEVLIKALDANGNAATATTRLRVAGSEPNALVRLVNLKKNSMVQGVVPLEVKLDPSIKNPYVMFFVNNEFLALTNFAPFTYNWDSSKVANGANTLTIKVYDGDTAAQVQALEVPIRVNNPGGYTDRQTETPDLAPPKPTVSVGNRVKELAGKAAAPEIRTALQGIGRGLSYELRQTTSPFASRLGTAPKEVARAATSIAKSNTEVKVAPVVGPKANNLTSAPKPGVLGLLSSPKDLVALTGSAQVGGISRQTARLPRSGNIAMLPSTQSGRSVAAPKTPNQPLRVVPVASVTHKTGKGLPAFRTHSRFNGKTFEVAFDNSLIAFDVPPRVENGLPLAPFRAIFEHTGGTVEWYNQSKTVRAYNSVREIEFRMGESEAKVNNQPIQMETKPYVENGRAIVPLSFIRDSLNVKVDYDPATGRLRIESRK